MLYNKLNKLSLPSLIVLFAGLLFVSFTSCNPGKSGTAGDSKKEKDGFTAIFDGETLNGWEGLSDFWKVEDGDLVGFTTAENPLQANTFLIWRDGQPSDFELKLDFKISAGGNSGIQYRSEELQDPPFGMKGYQADIDGQHTYTGQNYEERGRGFLAKRGEIAVLEAGKDPEITGSLGDGEGLKSKISSGWNSLHLIVKGNHMQHYVNDVLMSEVTDNDSVSRKMEGHLGIQIHTGPPMEVRMKDIRLKDLTK